MAIQTPLYTILSLGQIRLLSDHDRQHYTCGFNTSVLKNGIQTMEKKGLWHPFSADNVTPKMGPLYGTRNAHPHTVTDSLVTHRVWADLGPGNGPFFNFKNWFQGTGHSTAHSPNQVALTASVLRASVEMPRKWDAQGLTGFRPRSPWIDALTSPRLQLHGHPDPHLHHSVSRTDHVALRP